MVMIKTFAAFLWGLILFCCVAVMAATLPFVMTNAYPELTYLVDVLGKGPDNIEVQLRLIAVFSFVFALMLGLIAAKRRAVHDGKWLIVLRKLRTQRTSRKGYRSKTGEVVGFFFSARGVASRGEFLFGVLVLGVVYLLVLQSFGAVRDAVIVKGGQLLLSPPADKSQEIWVHLSAFFNFLFPLTLIMPLVIRRLRDIGNRMWWLCLIVAWPWLFFLSQTIDGLLVAYNIPLWPFSLPISALRFITPGWLQGSDYILYSWLICWGIVLLLASGNAARYSRPPFGLRLGQWRWLRPFVMIAMVAAITVGGHQIYHVFNKNGVEWVGFERDTIAGRHRLFKDLVAARQGLQRYYRDVNAPPSNLQSLVEGIGQPGWRGPYLSLSLGMGDYRIDPSKILMLHGRFDHAGAFQGCRSDQLIVPTPDNLGECSVWIAVIDAAPVIIDYLTKPPVQAGIMANNMLYILLSTQLPLSVKPAPQIAAPDETVKNLPGKNTPEKTPLVEKSSVSTPVIPAPVVETSPDAVPKEVAQPVKKRKKKQVPVVDVAPALPAAPDVTQPDNSQAPKPE
jgi:uncharacterized membrane protein YhaH (DUF805 family)